MKITVEFANLDEFKQYMGVESPNLLAQASKETEGAPAPAPAETVQEPQEAPEPHAPKKVYLPVSVSLKTTSQSSQKTSTS